MEFEDNELLTMVSDFDGDAKDAIFKKYGYIIDIVIKKYRKTIYALNIDKNELRQEALLAFSDALVRYQSSKESSLPTFISICVERKILNMVRKHDTTKNRMNAFTVSLEQNDELYQRPLEEVIGNLKYEPLSKLEDEEEYQDLIKYIDEVLSPTEKDVYNLVVNGFGYLDIAKILDKEPKQIDNTIQRIRNKIKDKFI